MQLLKCAEFEVTGYIKEQRQAEDLAAQARPLLEKAYKLATAKKQTRTFEKNMNEVKAQLISLFNQCPKSYQDTFIYLVTDWKTTSKRDWTSGYMAALSYSQQG